jgi:hypothetical protein
MHLSENSPTDSSSTSTQQLSRSEHLLRLPSSTMEYEKATFQSPGFDSQPSLCLPFNEEKEREIIDAMINELNESFGLDFTSEYSTERHPKPATLIESSGSQTRKKISLVSGSRSGYIATEFGDNVGIIDLLYP